MLKFNTRIIPKEYCHDYDLYEIYANGEMKYLLKETIIGGGYGNIDELYEKHGILTFRDLANRYNKIK